MVPVLKEWDDEEMTPLCTLDLKEQLLANIEEIYSQQKDLLKEMQQRMSPYPYHTNQVGELFLRYVSTEKRI